MSKKNYMIFDLTLLTIIFCVIEGVLTFLSNQVNFMLEGFSVSFIVLYSLIGMFRWNLFGIIPGVCSAVVAIVVQNSIGSSAGEFSYSSGRAIGIVVGVALSCLLLFYLKHFSKKKIKESIPLLCGYVVLGYLIYIVSCFLCLLFIDKYEVNVCVKLAISGNLLNMVMSGIVLVVASLQRDFLVDMNEYLIYMNTVPDSIRLRKEINEDKPEALMNEITDSDDINDIALLDGGTLKEEDLIKLNKTFKEKEGENYHGTRKS